MDTLLFATPPGAVTRACRCFTCVCECMCVCACVCVCVLYRYLLYSIHVYKEEAQVTTVITDKVLGTGE